MSFWVSIFCSSCIWICRQTNVFPKILGSCWILPSLPILCPKLANNSTWGFQPKFIPTLLGEVRDWLKRASYSGEGKYIGCVGKWLWVISSLVAPSTLLDNSQIQIKASLHHSVKLPKSLAWCSFIKHQPISKPVNWQKGIKGREKQGECKIWVTGKNVHYICLCIFIKRRQNFINLLERVVCLISMGSPKGSSLCLFFL